jgi:hypothetical protein
MVLPPEIVTVLELPVPLDEMVWASVLSNRLVRSAVLPPDIVKILVEEFQAMVWASVSVSMSLAQAQAVEFHLRTWFGEHVVIRDTWYGSAAVPAPVRISPDPLVTSVISLPITPSCSLVK